MVAWTERPGDRQKDLRDLAIILESYVEPEDDRFHDECPPDLDYELRAAHLLGADVARRGTPAHRSAIDDFATRMTNPDGRASSLFLLEAIAVGRWTERMVALRFDALRQGLSPRA